MAAVTVNNHYWNVSGSLKDRHYNIGGASGDTLVVGMYNVRQVTVEPSTITGYSVAAATPTQGQSTITFTASAPFTGVDIAVIGS